LLGQHIGSAPDFAADQPALAQQLIGAADGADGGADVIGEVALRRQFRTGIDDALVDISLNAVSKTLIERAGAGGEIGEPICHGDNFLYCTAR
jgi:hypothetical protein